MDVVGVCWAAEEIADHLEEVVKSLGVVDVHVEGGSSVGARKEGQLEVAVAVECLEASVARKAGRWRVQRLADFVEEVVVDAIDA